MNDPLYKSKGFDTLEALKQIITSEHKTRDNAIQEKCSDKFLLDASLRIPDEKNGLNYQPYVGVEDLSNQMEELFSDTDDSGDPAEQGKQGAFDQLLTDKLVEKISQPQLEASHVSMAQDAFQNSHAALDLENCNLKESQKVFQTFQDKALRPMVVEIIREELRGSLGEYITSKIRHMIKCEVELAITQRSRDQIVSEKSVQND